MFEIREEVEDFFGSMDRDFDGRLSFEEFMGEVVFTLSSFLPELLECKFMRNDMKLIGKYNRKAVQEHGQEWGWGGHQRGELGKQRTKKSKKQSDLITTFIMDYYHPIVQLIVTNHYFKIFRNVSKNPMLQIQDCLKPRSL